jgi:aspartyl/asparaginyl-tRNA synthetase
MLDTTGYHNVVGKLRTFFLEKGLTEVPVQSRLSILAACEDPETVAIFNYEGNTWPLPQTGQMWLEYELLKNPEHTGFFCISTSYRNEPNPVEGRHDKIFPMFVFEIKGNQEDLMSMERELVKYIFDEDCSEISYETAAVKYDTSILDHKHEKMLQKDFGRAVILKDFPRRTDPFWNMRRHDNHMELYKKVDVIIDGIETIGSAERAICPAMMKEDFYTISDGGYAKLLFNKFGKDRVEKELNEYLSHDFFERFGGGMGLTRLSSAYKRNLS